MICPSSAFRRHVFRRVQQSTLQLEQKDAAYEALPSLTPVSGEYSFSNADLSTIKGISGTLSSEGKYGGVLDYIHVEGETRTPDFALAGTGNAVPLNTIFSACHRRRNQWEYHT